MSTKSEVLYHPVNGTTEQTWDGFSWPGFLFGIIWLAIKQLWVHFLVTLIIAIITAGFAAPFIWIYYGFKGNSHHKSLLLSKGYLTENQNEERGKASKAPNNIADELLKLAQLRDGGVISEDEFTDRKKMLFS